jgi:cyanophycinase
MARKIECAIPNGTLLIIGGKENKGQNEVVDKETPSDFKRLEILKSFIAFTRKKDPVIEVVTSATSEPHESFNEYKKVFHDLGVTSLGHIHHNQRSEVLADAMMERINQADGIFFAGGDQLKYTSLYGGTEFMVRMKERYISEKLVIAGTSAGAMALSTPMIFAGNDEVQEIGGEIKITTGLEFIKDVCVDTHFTNRGRFIRMAQVVMTNPNCIGIGIGEDTGLVVRKGLEGEVIGSGLIIIIEGFHIGETNVNDFLDKKPIVIRDLKVHILASGSTYHIPQYNPPHV